MNVFKPVHHTGASLLDKNVVRKIEKENILALTKPKKLVACGDGYAE